MKTFAKVGDSFQHVGLTNPEGFIEMQEQRPGLYNLAQADGTWGPDVVPVPQSISGPQGQLALVDLGLYHTARAHIDGMADPIDKLKAEIEWRRTTYERQSPFLNDLWQTLGGTQDQLDDAFRLAATK